MRKSVNLEVKEKTGLGEKNLIEVSLRRTNAIVKKFLKTSPVVDLAVIVHLKCKGISLLLLDS